MNKNHSIGFTLIEVLIVVVIIGILAAIGFPSYTKWVVESRRTEAYTALTQTAGDLEKFYSECGAYPTSGNPSNLVKAGGPRSCTTPAGGTLGRNTRLTTSGNYQLTLIVAADGQSYQLQAAPQGQQLAKDTDCGTLQITNTGAKSALGSNTGRCWRN